MATPIRVPGVNGPELPNTAQVRGYWPGGTHNSEADQDLTAHLVSAAPHLCRTHRAYLGRVARRLTAVGVLGVEEVPDPGVVAGEPRREHDEPARLVHGR